MNILRRSHKTLVLLLCVGLLMAIVPATVCAERWFLVDEWQGRSVEVDEDSLSLFNGNNRVKCYSKFIQNNIYAISLTYMDLENKSSAFGETKMFDATGKMIDSSPGDPDKYEPIQANTLGEKLFYHLRAYRDVEVYPKPKRVENGR